jgi:hypothetical protein
MANPEPIKAAQEVEGTNIPVLDKAPAEEVLEPSSIEPGAEETQGEERPEPQAETPAEPEEPQYVVDMRNRLQALEEKLEPKGEEPKENAPAEKREPTAEEWGQYEKAWGFARSKDEDGNETLAIDPRKLMDTVTKRLSMAVQMANDYADKLVHGNVSDIRYDSQLTTMSAKPEFAGIREYSNAIQEYLKGRYQPKDYGNPKFIADGFWWAKGRNMKNVVKQVKDAKEINKRIVQPSSPSGSGKRPAGGRLTPDAMTQEQRQIAHSTFRDMSPAAAEREYARLY